ncbi:MAG: hypothetical protein V3T18_10250, partial [Pseudomonadales bacterium]
VSLSALLLTGCATPQIGGPVAPADDVNAGILTLPGGRSVAVYPQDLAYTGEGHYRWPDGREYDGSWRAGVPDGMGNEQRRNGDTYRGMWREGRRHGHGELTQPEGSHYVGDFVSGLREGEGVESSTAGLYRGDWRQDVPEGSGTFHGNDGEIYEGQWRNGERHGFGRYTDKHGNRYEGDWSNDNPHGFGTMHNANSSSYRGQWHNGAQSGYGLQINASGLTYEGTWVANKREGFGQEQRPDGREYVGEWLADNRHGQGRESSVDGAFHDGAWEHNQTLGPGTRRDRMGMEISGVWNDNHVSSGLLTLPTGAEYAGPLLRKNGSEVQPPLLEWLEENAAANDPYAQLFLAKAYADYKRPLPDPAKALRWFSAAADAGIAEAQYRLATLIISDNTPRAIEFLAVAAAANHPDANALLGQYYLTGRWVPANSQMAMRYLETASNGGNMAARNNLAWILATDPDPANRDGAKALAVIKPIALLYRDWQHLDTLAAAYAEHGEFDAASQAQRSAVAAIAADYAPEATTQDTAELLQEMRSRLILYENGQPYREDAARSARGGQTP